MLLYFIRFEIPVITKLTSILCATKEKNVTNAAVMSQL